MTNRTRNKFSPEVRARAVRLFWITKAEAEERYYAMLEQPAMAA